MPREGLVWILGHTSQMLKKKIESDGEILTLIDPFDKYDYGIVVKLKKKVSLSSKNKKWKKMM